jgi:hypothetical protein
MGDRHFDVSPDGLTVVFSPAAPASAPSGNPVYRFDLRARKLTKLTASQAAQRLGPPPPPVVTRMSGFNTNAPVLNGHALALPALELARSAAALGDNVAVGTDFNIRLFDQNGHEIAAAHPVAAPVWSLASAGDKLLIAALGDGTFRWYALQGTTLTSIADLFVAADDRRWVIWTNEGFFDHADIGGKELVGYQLNHGKSDAPEFVGFDQLYRAFYAPDVVLARLQGQTAAPGRNRRCAQLPASQQAAGAAMDSRLHQWELRTTRSGQDHPSCARYRGASPGRFRQCDPAARHQHTDVALSHHRPRQRHRAERPLHQWAQCWPPLGRRSYRGA